MSGLETKSRAICILGMHRSGTSTVTRAINLLGACLGDDGLMPATPANPEGYWERLDIFELQKRLFKELGRDWDTAVPLPEGWIQSSAARNCKAELLRLVRRNFADKILWAWKDPKTCLTLPLWKEVLNELGIELRCVVVVRGPLDVAGSLNKRDGIPIDKAFAIWFNYYITGLKVAAGIPCGFLSYDRFLESWESELRKCAADIDIPWPVEDQALHATMNSFLKPGLRHNQSAAAELQAAPPAVQELYKILSDMCARHGKRDEQFEATVNRLYSDFINRAPSVGGESGEAANAVPILRPSYLKRTWQRWQRSFHKRFGRRSGKRPA